MRKFAIAQINGQQGDKYCACVCSDDSPMYFVHRDDMNGAKDGDYVLIAYVEDDQFAYVYPTNMMEDVVMKRECHASR